jgi:flagellar basal-body rod protein FlgF
MADGIYTALSGAVARVRQLEVIGNNLANINTVGFKQENLSFRSALTAHDVPDAAQGSNPMPARWLAQDKIMADVAGSFVDLKSGSIKQTDNALDFAVQGDGYFLIDAPGGTKLTRNGNFSINSENILVTTDGHPVQDESGGPVVFARTGKVEVNEKGEIYVNRIPQGKLALVMPDNEADLFKVGNNLMGLRNAASGQGYQNIEGSIAQGSLESSNVNSIEQMTEMIKVQRLYDTILKSIKSIDRMEGSRLQAARG